MNRLLRTSLYISLVALFLAVTIFRGIASASFNKNNLIADGVFDQKSSMSAAQIDSFLNGFSSSCIKSSIGFRAIDPTGYSPSTGYSYGGYTTAGTVIYHAAQAYDINPRVLLATLQKEQSLVTGTAGCSTLRYVGAMGYGCPDSGTTHNYSGLKLYKINNTVYSSVSGTCVSQSSQAGFSQQVIRGAWLLKFGQQRSRGNINWAIVRGSWDNSDDPQSCYAGPMTQGTYQVCPSGTTTYYDGYQTIDSQSVHMDTGATAALYWYTPHLSGNQHFVSIYEGWFGSTQSTLAWNWELVSQRAYTDSARTIPYTTATTAAPGDKIYVRVVARNIGSQPWDNSFVKIGTSRPNDRTSIFQDVSWLSSGRPASMTESSATPEQLGTFDFTLKAPSQLGTYKEYFNLLAENRSWMHDIGLYFQIDVVNPISIAQTAGSKMIAGESLFPGNYVLSDGNSYSNLIFQTDGNLVLYNNYRAVWSSGTSNKNSARLVMQGDGNLVLYNKSGTAIWNSATNGNSGAYMQLQTDGNIVIYDIGNSALWSSSTRSVLPNTQHVNTTLVTSKMYPGQMLQTADRKYKFVLQGDGNLVLYSASNVLWSSRTNGKSVGYLAMQGDGNLVLYGPSGALWYTRTSGYKDARLFIQQDGNLVLYTRNDKPIWNTETSGK